MDVGFTDVTVQRNCSEHMSSRMRSKSRVLAHGPPAAAAAEMTEGALS